MKIYKVTPVNEPDYDDFAAACVCAENEEHVKRLLHEWNIEVFGNFLGTGSILDNVNIQEIDPNEAGVIVVSFF